MVGSINRIGVLVHACGVIVATIAAAQAQPPPQRQANSVARCRHAGEGEQPNEDKAEDDSLGLPIFLYQRPCHDVLSSRATKNMRASRASPITSASDTNALYGTRIKNITKATASPSKKIGPTTCWRESSSGLL